jgi:heme exporter protein B
MLRAFWGMFRRDATIYIQHPADLLAALGFFGLISSLFLILFGFLPSLLVQIGPALIWVAVLLALLMSIESILRSDYQVGALDHLLLSQYPLALLCFAKILAHILVIGLPLLLAAPVLALLFHFNSAAVLALVLSLLLGIPTISLIASVGAALTLGLERGAWLVMLLILPLLLPLILLGVHAVMCAVQGLAWHADILLLSALLLFSLVAVPLLMALTLRVSLE